MSVISDCKDKQSLEDLGNIELISKLRRERGGIAAYFSRLENALRQMIQVGEQSFASLEEELELMKETVDRIVVKSMQLKELLSHDQVERQQVDDYYEAIKDRYNKLKEEITDLRERENQAIKPEDSASQVSHKSIASRLKIAEAKNTALRLRSEALKKQQQIKRQMLELQLQEEALALETEIAAAAVETNALSDHGDTEEKPVSATPCLNSKAEEFKMTTNHHLNQSTKQDKESRHETTQPPVSEGNKEEQILTMIHLPRADLMKFDGDPLKYWIFIRSFDNSIGSTSISDSSKLTRLLQYCSGKALSVIECCAVMNPDYGYKEARRILHDRFGNQFVISRAWIQRVTDGPILRYGDNTALQQYADSVKSCIVTLSAMGRLTEVDNQDRIRKMTEKLPVGFQNRWRNQAVGHLRTHGYYPDINEFARFIEMIADEANDPVFGNIHFENRERGTRGNFKKGTAFQTHVQNRNPKPACKLCSRDHAIYMCNTFRQMHSDARLKFMKEQKLCFNCFASNHASYECMKASMCRVDRCNKRHSTLLHHALQTYRKVNVGAPVNREVPVRPQECDRNPELKQQSGTQIFSTHHSAHDSNGAGISRVALPVVPVKVRKNCKECLTTYAFLDSGSTNSFCSQELYDNLGLEGKKTSLSLTTLTSEECQSETSCISLEIADVEGRNQLRLPYVYVIPKVPVPEKNKVVQKDVNNWPHMHGIRLPEVDEAKVSILIGQDNPGVLAPLDVRRGKVDEPYAVLTAFGWTLNGPLKTGKHGTVVSNFIQSDEVITNCLERLWKLDQVSANDNGHLSRQDKQVLNLWKNTAKISNGHYTMPIPFKTEHPDIPNNYSLAKLRLESLGRKLERNKKLHENYSQGINDLLEKGYAEKIHGDEITTDKPVWYLPHHAVTSDKKPDKMRIVFDCSAKYGGTSLNEEVLQGPDLTNKLLGVLQRFRVGQVAIMGDIEAMFHQVKVEKKHRDVLRFLWWPGGDLSLKPEVCRMTVHLFGGIWSPSCASYTLQRTALDNAADFDKETVSTVSDNFYVDDCLKSTTSEERAIHLINETTELLHRGGFNITKWTSNRRRVVESIPTGKRAKDLKNIDLSSNILPQERALGVVWDTETDEFGFIVKPKRKPMTRRGLISVISSVYHPFGVASPVILKAKRLFQHECRLKKGWDDPLEPDSVRKFLDWLHDLPQIENLRIPRCLLPVDFGEVVKCELHHFSDASLNGYGAVSYLRAVNTDGVTHCSFLMAKARLPPMKDITIPRLELSAAVESVKLNESLLRELNLNINSSTFWTDSMIVLHYIKSEKLRFQTFVGNRVSYIQESTSSSDWRYVKTDINPGDHASRGLDVRQVINCEQWLNGPKFLWKEESQWPTTPDVFDIEQSNLEIRKSKVFFSDNEVRENAIEKLLNRYSSWTKLQRTVCWILRLKKCLLQRTRSPKKKQDSKIDTKPLSVDELRAAELEIVRYLQKCHFSAEIKQLKTGQSVKKSSSLHQLEPMINSEGILCVGGRLSNAPITEQAKHQMILPKNHHVDQLIAYYTHEILGHSGTEHVLSHLRQRFWIIGARVLLKSIFRKCVHCQRMQSSMTVQQMAELPTDRVTPHRPPFTYIGVDCFGPFEVKRARSIVKRYGCIFTCLTTRAVHIEKLDTMNTDSFIDALRRFVSRRGKPEKIRSDNGSNFKGACRELKEAIQAWNLKQIDTFLTQKDIQWEFNPPTASHMGGVWERQIRTVRKVLNGLSDECLHTLFCEVEAIINSRPITVVSDNVRDAEALTPNHLLLLRRSESVPPGEFHPQDVYRQRWRHVQFLSDVFWRRWIREYLPTLQLRQKWLNPTYNLCAGDIVLITDENTPRKLWPLARVEKTFPGRDGLVRSVLVRSRGTILTRPIHKLCLLESVAL